MKTGKRQPAHFLYFPRRMQLHSGQLQHGAQQLKDERP
jgi:hypothetical protein